MEDKIKEIFNIDNSVVQDKKIKSLFYDHESFNSDKRKIFDENVESIKLTAIFNDETINIPSYKDLDYLYEEIYLITAQLKTDKNFERIVNLIHLLIPNPTILLLSFEDRIQVSGSISRINKNNDEKAILEEIYQSIWLPLDSVEEKYKDAVGALNTKNYSYNSLKDFYEDLIKVILATNFIEIADGFKYSKKWDILYISSLVRGLRDNSLQIQTYKNEQKQTTNFGDKVVLQNKVLKAEEQKEFIKNQVKELIKNL